MAHGFISGNVTASYAISASYAMNAGGLTGSIQVPVLTDWTSYTPTVAGGFGIVTNLSASWRRVGGSMEIQGTFSAGTVSAQTGSISLPIGYTISGSDFYGFGFVESLTAGVNATVVSKEASSSVRTTSNVSGWYSTSDRVGYSFSVPISGWSATQTINF